MELKDLVVISELSEGSDDLVIRLYDPDYGVTTLVVKTIDEVVTLVREKLSILGFFLTLENRIIAEKGEADVISEKVKSGGGCKC